LKYLSTLLLSTLVSISVQASEWKAVIKTDPITDEVTKYAFITSKDCNDNCPTLTFRPTIPKRGDQRDCFDLDFKEEVKVSRLFNSYYTKLTYRIDKEQAVKLGSTELISPTTARICYPTTDELKLADF